MIDLAGFPLWVEIVIFLCAATAVWFAGSRLTIYAGVTTQKSRIGRAFGGMVLLGAVSSLPEISSVATGAAYGNAPLAVNNLLGSLAFNIVILAIADATIHDRAVTALVAGLDALYQALLSIVALVLVVVVMIVGDIVIGPIGLGSAVIFVFVLAAFWLASGYASRSRWRIAALEDDDGEAAAEAESAKEEIPDGDALKQKSLGALVVRMIVVAALIVIAGYALSRSAEAIINQTGLNANLVGLVLLGAATSLPELATAISAVRMQRFDMAMADVFGTNLFDLGLLVVADALYPNGPILRQTGQMEIVASLLCLLLTAVYAIGLLERRDRAFFRLGADSIAVLALYVGGLIVLYFIS